MEGKNTGEKNRQNFYLLCRTFGFCDDENDGSISTIFVYGFESKMEKISLESQKS